MTLNGFPTVKEEEEWVVVLVEEDEVLRGGIEDGRMMWPICVGRWSDGGIARGCYNISDRVI